MARWMLYLSKFDIKLVHIAGRKNIQADALSRRLDLCPEGTDNENVIVLPEHLFINLINMELQRRIANTGNMDYDTAEAIEELLGEGPNCQGFTGRTPARVRDGSLPKGLTESPAQLPRLGQLQTRVGSKSLVMQDC